MKTDLSGAIEPTNSAIVVEDRTCPDERRPERVRIKLDEMDVVIAVKARATDSNQLVATCDLPFLRLGARLNLEWAERERGAHRGTLDWVALDVTDDSRMPCIQLGLALDRVGDNQGPTLAQEQTLAQGRPLALEANEQDTALDEPAPCGPSEERAPTLPQPPHSSSARRWLGRLALVALGVLGAGVGSAIAARSDEAPPTSAAATVVPVPLSPQIIVTPPLKSARTGVAAAILRLPAALASSTVNLADKKKTTSARRTSARRTSARRTSARRTSARRTSASSSKALRARRTAARRARLRRIKTVRYLAWARKAMKQRRPRRARHLARLVLLLDPANRAAAAILGKR